MSPSTIIWTVECSVRFALDAVAHLGRGDYLHWTMEVRLFGVGIMARLRGLAMN